MAFYMLVSLFCLTLIAVSQYIVCDDETIHFPINGTGNIRLDLHPDDGVYRSFGERPRGEVEVYIDGEWGPICSNSDHRMGDDNDAKVICRELGYACYYEFYQSTYTESRYSFDVTGYIGKSKAFYYGLNCAGYENSLTHCDFIRKIGTANDCLDHKYKSIIDRKYQFLGVVCEPDRVSCARKHGFTQRDGAIYFPLNGTGNIRLSLHPDDSVYSKYNERPRGQVEVYFDDEWGPVCYGYGFGDNEADVVCRELGYACSNKAYLSKHVDSRDLPARRISSSAFTETIRQGRDSRAFYYGLNCAGHEERLNDCKFTRKIGSPDDCVERGYREYEYQFAGVVCESDKSACASPRHWLLSSDRWFLWVVLALAFLALVWGIYTSSRKPVGCCYKPPATQVTAHTTSNVQDVVITVPQSETQQQALHLRN